MSDLDDIIKKYSENDSKSLSFQYSNIPVLPEKILVLSNLINLTITNCNLTKLINLPENLDFLNCSNNNIKTVDNPISDKIKHLNISNNYLESTNNLGSPENLNIGYNKIYELLNLSSNIKTLNCENNNIEEIGSNIPKNVVELDCNNNSIQSLGMLPDSIEILIISYNAISELNNLPQSLVELECNFNKINKINYIPSNTNMIDCSGNDLEEIIFDVNKEYKLEKMDCSNNNISNIKNIPSSLNYLDISSNRIDKYDESFSNIKTIIITDNPCDNSDNSNSENNSRLCTDIINNTDTSDSELESLNINIDTGLESMKYLSDSDSDNGIYGFNERNNNKIHIKNSKHIVV
jgi:Leucine-rich repeat (LRR) protein